MLVYITIKSQNVNEPAWCCYYHVRKRIIIQLNTNKTHKHLIGISKTKLKKNK